jgi:hypothetical protein
MAFIAVPLAVTVGGMFLMQMLAPKQRVEGARLSDINVPAVSPGNPIIRHWGTMKLGSQVIWTSKLIETKHTEKVGGKGGGGAEQTTYTYSVDCALGICQGPVANVKRVRANQKLIWINPEFEGEQEGAFDDAYMSEGTRLLDNDVDAEEAHVGAFFFAFNEYRIDEYTPGTIPEAKAYVRAHPLPGTEPNWATVDQLFDRMFQDLDKDATYEEYKKRYDGLAIYLGSSRQLPDPTIESYKGVGNVPAFRGTCYMVFKNLQLEDFGNTIPAFHVEVIREDGTVQLHEIIADICRESGLADDEFNVTCGMQAVSVHGFAITDRMSGRDAIQQLQTIFPFDATETAYTLRFAHSQRRPQALIRREDFGAHIFGDEPPPTQETIRTHDFDLPRKLTLKYQEPSRNYSLNTAMAQRLITESNLEEEVSVAIAMTRQEAKSLIEGALAMRFHGRRTYKIILPRKYAILEPGDVVLVPDPDSDVTSYALRLLEVAIGNNGLCEASFSDYHYQTRIDAIVSDDIIGDDDEEELPTQGSRTYAYLLDLPLLTDTEADNVGFYALLSGTRSGWSGGALLVDFASGGTVPVFDATDPVEVSGATWYVAARSVNSVAHGFCLTNMPIALPGLWDYATKLRVKVLDPSLEMFSVAPAELLAQALNVAVIGDEIVQFAKVEDKGNGIWELSQFLRGQRGTEWAIDQHSVGDRFVMLGAAAMERVTHNQNQLNISTRYRAVSLNDSPEDVEDIWFANTGNSLRPYAPYLHRALRDETGAVHLEWLPRVRQNGGMINGQETVLDQPFERYEVEVLNGGVPVRTETIENARQWDYSASTIEADFGGLEDSITIRLYQIGQIVGRGFARELIV